MRTFILFAVPPLVGALIGFITNVIAIKMLFRPLREIRVFGIRIPFTPGILPRQRHKLADSIGAMVERELLTPELLRERISREDVQQKLKNAISVFTGKILDRHLVDFFKDGLEPEMGGFARSLGASFLNSPAFATIKNIASDRICTELDDKFPVIRTSLGSFLRRSDIHRELEYYGRVFLSDVILKLNVFQRFFISAAQYDRTLSEQMPEIIDSLIVQIEDSLKAESVRVKAVELLKTIIERNFSAEYSPGGLFSFVRESFVKIHGGDSLKALLAINGVQKEQLDDLICSRFLRLAGAEIENLLNTINVKTMVSQRIDALDMIRVEKIILDVMANQLKWIDVFGALLGFLIGILQVLINFFLR